MRTANDHPYVIKFYQVYDADKMVHLVLELLEGGELFERIKHKRSYSEREAVEIMKNILEALKYFHALGIVHRDLKPENLILKSKEDDYDVKIADFGLASFVEEGKKLSLPCGSPGYVAPEVLDDRGPGYDTQADVFSVGVILYVLLTGRPAFPGTNYRDIISKNKRGEVEYQQRYWSRISETGKDLVQKLLKKNPDERLSAENALKHPWFTGEEVRDEALDLKLDEVIQADTNDQARTGISSNAVTPSTTQGPEDGKDAQEVDIKLLTATPVMAGRGLRNAPASPSPSMGTPQNLMKTPVLT